jgi:hypothetical protein
LKHHFGTIEGSTRHKLEEATHFLGQMNRTQIIMKKRLHTAVSHKVYSSLLSWILNERGRKYGIDPISEIFSLVCIVQEKDKIITRRTYSKEELRLSKIYEIISEAKHSDNTIALSPIFLTRKSQVNDGGLIALMLYDVKNDQVLAFNIHGLPSSIDRDETNPKQNDYDIVRHIFMKSITKEGDCTSYVPLPFHFRWYTVLPWICYIVLSQVNIGINENPDSSVVPINIVQFFTFGNASPAIEGHSFDYRVFAPNRRGRASCIMTFRHGDCTISYTLRFDQHPGKPFVHMDFSFYDKGGEHKLISHRPLDLEEVYDNNHKLFFAMMFAGLFDGYFNTLLNVNLKGVDRLIKRNPACLCSLTHVWRIETAISWLNAHNMGSSKSCTNSRD